MFEEPIRERFLDEIERRGADDRYIDRDEEREILEIAIQLGMGVDRARAALADVCRKQGYAVESAVLKRVREGLEAAAREAGRIDRKAFDGIVRAAQRELDGKKTEREVKKMIVLVMEDTGNNRVKVGWFRDWYAALKRDLGVA